ncbi:hypothetical protein J2T60_002032 [Natronospira proteinivora]|uniref:Flagellin-like protein n=1 Tax=Natronospira proteinivora TaxID=1807133 RepID=A0ABT1GDK3_9GAMM|nr:hypothetical protein [Natronospira proteinivora]
MSASNDSSRTRMGRANRLYSLGLGLMLFGVGLSVLALILI